MRALRRGAAAVGFGVLLIGCGSDNGFTPTVENVSGSYSALSFTVESAVGVLDLLALGALVEATLNPDGTTSGRLFVPGAADDGGDLDEDLTGTWTLEGNTVTFSQTGDPFLQDVPFTATEGRLTGEGTFEGQTIRLVLEKTE